MKKRRSKRLMAVLLCMAMMLTSNISTLAEGEPTEASATAVREETQAPVVGEQPGCAVTSNNQQLSVASTLAEEPGTVEEPVAAQEEVAPVAPVEQGTSAEQTTPAEQGTPEQQESTEAPPASGEPVAPETPVAPEETEPTEEPTEETTNQIPVLEYEDEQIKATVTADTAGVIPEGVTLKVVPITAEDKETKEQYEEVGKKLQEKVAEEEKEIAGYLAYDITIIDADGNKVEPNGNVKVSMEYKKAELPKEVAEQELSNVEVTVHHLEEDAVGEVQKVVDMGAEKKATVDTLSTDEGEKIKKVEAETESFSVFTITWTYEDHLVDQWDKKFTITVKYVDDSGKEIVVENLPKEVTFDKNEVIDLEQYWKPVAGYNQVKIAVDRVSGKSITSLKRFEEKKRNFISSYTEYYIKYREKDATTYTNWLQANVNNNVQNDIKEGKIYFVYEKIDDSPFKIVDNIIDDGSLTATFKEQPAGEVTYTWYRRGSEKDEYTKVEKVNFKDGNSNISEDGSKLYPAYDEGARKWYKVKAKIKQADGTETEMESETYQVPYYNEVQNGGFEAIKYNRHVQLTNEEYKEKGIWQSTGIGGNGTSIEIVTTVPNGGLNDYTWKGDWIDGEEGDGTTQFAEINCDEAGALYQDVLTVKGQPLNYWLSHRARGNDINKIEYDEMYLVIMPTQVAIKEHLDNQTDLNKYLQKIGVDLKTGETISKDKIEDILQLNKNAEGVRVVRITSDDKEWHKIRGKDHVYYPTSNLTRFFFMSGRTAVLSGEGKPTLGNFVDGIGFTHDLPPAEEGKFNFTLKKKFEGLGNEQLQTVKQSLQFKISVKNKDKQLTGDQIKTLLEGTEVSKKESRLAVEDSAVILEASEMQEDAFGDLSISFENRSIGETGSVYEFTVEELGKELSGYTVTTKSKVSIMQDQTAQNPVEADDVRAIASNVQGKTSATVEFTNKYRGENSKVVNFTKVWDDGDNKFLTRPESLDVTLKATVTYIDKDSDEQLKELTKEELGIDSLTVTLSDKNNWKTSWKVPVYYKVEGTGARVPIQYTVEEGTVGGDYVYSAGSLQKGEINRTPTTFDNSLVNGEGNAQTTLPSSKKMMKAKSSLNATNASNKDIGEPSHNKYVTYNKNTDDYTLNLDVTGKKGEQEGVDVLFVIDTSGSMSSDGWFSEGLLKKVKGILANNDNNAIDQILGEKGNVNSAAFVSFAGKGETTTSSWYDYNTKERMKTKINNLRATGGTNWTYAMMKAKEMLDARADNGNEKVVIFLSDGEPTFSINSRGQEYGHGNRFSKEYLDHAVDVVNNSNALKNAKMYSVYLTKGTLGKMDEFAKRTNSELINGSEDLNKELQGILNKIIPTYEEVMIEDTLSEYVVFSEGTPTVTVTKKTASGITVLQQVKDYNLELSAGNKVKVAFVGELDDAATYTISFRIKPSKKVEDEFKGDYPNTGAPGTGTTSEGKQGYHSNESATLTYSIKGTNKKGVTANYPLPVVQINTHALTFKKVWAEPNKDHPKEIELDVAYTDGTKGKVTLSEKDEWTTTISKVPATRKIQSVTEILPEEYKDSYTPSYEISNDGKIATVTNSYSKITTKNITVQKEWIGKGPVTDVKVGLYYTDSKTDKPKLHETVTLSASKEWKYTWNNLHVPDGRVYAIREESIPANYTSNITYVTSEDGETTTATIKNVYDSNCRDENYYIVNTLQTMPLTITKVWDDDNNSQNKRPTTLDVTVQEGAHNLQFTLSGQDNVWKKTATVLKRKDNRYSATENLPSGNDYEMTDYAINVRNGVHVSFTNKIKTQSITVTKQWIDTFKDNSDRPGSIRFKLFKDDVEYGTYMLTADDIDKNGNSWTKVIDNLPVGTYTVVEYVEEDDPKYDYSAVHATATNDGNGNYTLSNKINWHIVKTTHATEDKKAKPLEGAEFQLKQGENILATGITDKQGVINWAVNEDNALSNLNGTYTLVETKAPVGYMVNSKGWEVRFDENGLLIGGKNLADHKDLSITATRENGIRISVENLELYELPSTGGSGIYWYVIGGTLLMLAAVLLLYRKNRYKKVVK